MDKKVALITGANKGIGFETARRLREQGFTVLLGARDSERGEAAAARLRNEGLDVRPLLIDVADEQTIEAATASAKREVDRVDVLVNNAGANLEFGDGLRPRDVPVDLFRATYDTNVFGRVRVVQAFLPLLTKGERPRVVNLSSTLGSLTALSDPSHPLYGLNLIAYNSSKTALNAVTVSLAKDLREDGVAVVAVCPGWVRTDMGGEGAPRSVEEGARRGAGRDRPAAADRRSPGREWPDRLVKFSQPRRRPVRILVTGATGYVGRRVAEKLVLVKRAVGAEERDIARALLVSIGYPVETPRHPGRLPRELKVFHERFVRS